MSKTETTEFENPTVLWSYRGRFTVRVDQRMVSGVSGKLPPQISMEGSVVTIDGRIESTRTGFLVFTKYRSFPLTFREVEEIRDANGVLRWKALPV